MKVANILKKNGNSYLIVLASSMGLTTKSLLLYIRFYGFYNIRYN